MIIGNNLTLEIIIIRNSGDWNDVFLNVFFVVLYMVGKLQSQRIHAVYYYLGSFFKAFVCFYLVFIFLKTLGCCFFTRFFGFKKISNILVVVFILLWCITVTHTWNLLWMDASGTICIYMCKKSRQGFFCNFVWQKKISDFKIAAVLFLFGSQICNNNM